MITSEAAPADIAAAIRFADAPIRAAHKSWQRRAILDPAGGLCAFCQEKLDLEKSRRVVLAYVVPLQLGGPAVDENRVVSCTPCARDKANRDLLCWTGRVPMAPCVRADLLQKREAVLYRSSNHLTPHAPRVPVEKLRAHLAHRFTHPRCRVFALLLPFGGFIGWTPNGGAEEALAQAAVFLKFSTQAAAISHDGVTLFRVPSAAFLDAVWLLIEHGVLVVALEISDALRSEIGGNDWRQAWKYRYGNLAQLRRRRSRSERVSAPGPAPVKAENPKAKWKRERDARLRNVGDWRTFEAAQGKLKWLEESVAKGGEHAPSAREIHEAASEALRLKAKALGVKPGPYRSALQ